jgi:hypothetical protein
MTKSLKTFLICTVITVTSCTEAPLVKKIIAHGGGAIDGFTYTNSQEALNSSYKKGCRLFELDICETSDGKFVAAHDWAHYKENTNYAGEIDETPLSEDEFLSLKIFEKFTPINIDFINKWFKKHKKAILITDKINEPKKFFGDNGFLFKDRCIMELFSWDAVDEAIEIGVTPMPSDNLVFDKFLTEEQRLQKLKDLNIKYVAISRWLIANNDVYLEKLKNQDIKVFVFHVNFDEGKDENYVYENEFCHIFGMYADNLEILKRE